MEIEDLKYDEDSPSGLIIIRIVTCGGGRISKHARDSVGGVGTHGYWQVNIKGKLKLGHRVVWEIVNGPIPEGKVIDHLDGNRLNNKIENLRVVDNILNRRNVGRNSRNKTNYPGVHKVAYSVKGEERWLFRAQWKDLEGIVRSKTFTFKVYGEEEAFRLACEYRDKMVMELNKLGAGYTDRHMNKEN